MNPFLSHGKEWFTLAGVDIDCERNPPSTTPTLTPRHRISHQVQTGRPDAPTTLTTPEVEL